MSVTLTPLEQSLLLGFLVLFTDSGAWIDTENEPVAIEATSELIQKVITASPPISGGGGDVYMEKIADYTPSGSDNFINFSVPTSGYNEFIVRVFGGGGTAFARLAVRFNGDTTSTNYLGVNQAGTSITGRNFLIGVSTSGQESKGEMRIFAPHSATLRKSFWCKSGFSNDYLDTVGAWFNTSPITEIRLTSSNATVIAGFRVELWGVLA